MRCSIYTALETAVYLYGPYRNSMSNFYQREFSHLGVIKMRGVNEFNEGFLQDKGSSVVHRGPTLGTMVFMNTFKAYS